MDRLLMRSYWVSIIGVGLFYGVVTALAAGFILLPFLLGVMQRSARIKHSDIDRELGQYKDADNVQAKDGINSITLSGDMNDMINPLAITSSKF